VEEGIIHEVERLGRDGGHVAICGAGVGIGTVEKREESAGAVALAHHVNAALGGAILGREWSMLREAPFIGRGERMLMARVQVECARRDQDGVAKFFRRDAAAGKGGEGF